MEKEELMHSLWYSVSTLTCACGQITSFLVKIASVVLPEGQAR